MTISNQPLTSSEMDFDQPVINIGSHSDNDIVLKGDGIRPFHVSLILQDGKCQVLSLETDSDVRLDGKLIETAEFSLAGSAHRLTIGGNALLLEYNKVFDGLHIRINHTASSNTADAEQHEKATPTPVASTPISDKAILLNLFSQTDEVEAGQVATYQLKLTNSGPYVASFKVVVEGVPAEWVSVSPEEINLYESQQEKVQINILPPRQYDSTAGQHNLKISVSSPNYPGHQEVVPASLRIKPYYEFSLGNLSPREQNIPWGKRLGNTSLPITNLGNCPADFAVSAVDDENGCSFDFVVQDGVRLNRQAMLHIPAGQTLPAPIEITPHRRPVFMRSKRYAFTTTTQITSQPGAPQMVSGSLKAQPLFPWWALLLGFFTLVIGLFILTEPYIYSFNVVAGKDVIELGDFTTLNWSVSPFATNVTISPQPATNGQTSLPVKPTQSTTYKLTTGNWLSSLLHMDQQASINILVVPPTPTIKTFTIDTTRVAKGKAVKVVWSVTDADKIVLTAGNIDYEMPKDQLSGEKELTLDKDDLVTLEAKNDSGQHDLRSYFVSVVPPSITPIFRIWVGKDDTETTGMAGKAGMSKLVVPDEVSPDPKFPYLYAKLIPDSTSINGYTASVVQGRDLDKGEQVLVEWNVKGTDTDKVEITPFTGSLPAIGNQPSFPQESMNFSLTAKSGDLENIYVLPVKVFNGQPPTAPTINFFQGVPKSNTGPVDVVFSWSVSGTWDHIQLGSSSNPKIADVNPLGSMKIKVSESGTYILTAWNGKLSSAVPLDITINPELLAPGLSVTGVSPLSDQYLIGNKITVTTKFSTTHKPSPTGTITVTDGLSTCSITLPATSCDLVFKSAGNKKVWASYAGDTIYAQSTSSKYPGNKYLYVISPTVILTPSFYLKADRTAPIVVTSQKFNIDEPLYIRVKVTPSGGVLPDDGKSEVRLRVCKQGQSECTQPVATTVTVVGGVGTVDMSISKFPGAGLYELRFDYSHYDGLLAPAHLAVPNVQVLQMSVYLTLPPSPKCLSSIPKGETCSIGYNLANPSKTIVLFYFHQTVGGDYLYSSMPKPDKNLFHFAEGSSKLGCDVMTLTLENTNVVYALKCTVDVLNKAVLTVKYTYNNNKNADYYMGDPSKDFTLDPFYLRPARPTTISFTSLNPFVGQIITLTRGGVLSLRSNDTPIANVTGKITISSTSTTRLFDIAPNSNSTCTINANGNVISNVDVDETCQIFFRKAGPWNLHFVFSGDDNYGSVASDYSVNVQAQSPSSITWSYLKNSNFTAWDDVASIQTSTVSGRIIFDMPNGYSNKVFDGVELSLELAQDSASSSCVLIQPNPAVISYQNQQAIYNFAVNCTKGVLGVKATLTLKFVDAEQKNFDASVSTRQALFSDTNNSNIGGIYFELVPNLDKNKNSKSFVFDWRSSSPSPKNIPLLFAGETYTIHLMYQPVLIYKAAILGGCPGSLCNAAMDFIQYIDKASNNFRKIDIQFPPSWFANVSMSISGSDCSMNGNSIVVPLKYRRDYDVTGDTVWHYVELSSPAMQTSAPPGYSFAATNCNVTFNYSTETLGGNPHIGAGSSTTFVLDQNFTEPTSSFPYSDDIYTVDGLTKATIKPAVTRPSQWERDITLTNQDTYSVSHPRYPLTDTNVSTWFDLGYPSCLTVNGTITTANANPSAVTWQIIPPASGSPSCTGTLSIYYKENAYFPKTLLWSEPISIP